MERIEWAERDWWNPAWWSMRGLGAVPAHQYCAHSQVLRTCDLYRALAPQPIAENAITPNSTEKKRWEYRWSVSATGIGSSAETNQVAVGGKYYFILLNCRSLALEIQDLTLVLLNSEQNHLQSGEMPILSPLMPIALAVNILLLVALAFNAISGGRSLRDKLFAAAGGGGASSGGSGIGHRRRASGSFPLGKSSSTIGIKWPFLYKILLIAVVWHTVAVGLEWLVTRSIAVRGFLSGPSAPAALSTSASSSSQVPSVLYPLLYRAFMALDMFWFAVLFCLTAKGVNITRGSILGRLGPLSARECISLLVVCTGLCLGRYWQCAFSDSLTKDSLLLVFSTGSLWTSILTQFASASYHIALVIVLKYVTANMSLLLAALNSQLLLLRRVDHRMDLERTGAWAKQRLLRATATTAVAFALVTAVALVVNLFLAPDKQWVSVCLRIFSLTVAYSVFAFLLRLSPAHLVPIAPANADYKKTDRISSSNEEEMSLIISSEPRGALEAEEAGEPSTGKPNRVSFSSIMQASQLLLLFPPTVSSSGGSSSELQPFLAVGAAPGSTFFEPDQPADSPEPSPRAMRRMAQQIEVREDADDEDEREARRRRRRRRRRRQHREAALQEAESQPQLLAMETEEESISGSA